MGEVRSGRKFVAPDGGYGWVIVLVFACSNIIIIPLMQGFALLYRSIFVELEFTATDTSTIINVNAAFGLVLGLFVGPLLKTFGYRKVAMAGSLFMFTGFLLCSTSTSFTDFILYYGIINSTGYNITIASYGLALNTYFNKRRNMASGLSTGLTGLGPVLMPYLMSILMSNYGVRGTAMILSGMVLHSFVGALLLQPVSWHSKKVIDEEEKVQELKLLTDDDSKPKTNGPIEEEEDEEDAQDVVINETNITSAHRSDTPVMIPVKTVETGGGGGIRYASKLSLYDKNLQADSTWWRRESNIKSRLSLASLRVEKKKKKSLKWVTKLVKLFDLDLLKDSGYRNIWLGMSLAFTGELNFSLMTPLILGDKGMSIDQTAQLMSALATTDIVFRFISPFVGDYLKWSAKHMYMGSLVLLVITRSSLTFAKGYYQMLASCLVIGVAKGLRTVYMALVIPSSVPLEKLPSAAGLQTLLNGIFLLAAGPFLGYLRDTVGDYNICVHVINSFSIITIILWTSELLYNTRKARKQQQNQEQEAPER